MARKKKDVVATGAATQISDEEAKKIADEVREKELKEMNGGKLPELNNAEAEIRRATEKHEAEERETAQTLALNDKATGRKVETEGDEKPKGNDQPRVKPVMLSMAADDQRKKDLAVAYEKSAREGRRMNLVAGHNFVSGHFVGRNADSVSLDEYIAYRDTAVVALPAEAGDFQFTQEANNYVRSRGRDEGVAICAVFKGRYNVTLAEVQTPALSEKILMKQAEIFVASRQQGKKAVRVDAGSPVNCQSSQSCTRLFVPLAWLEYDQGKNQEHWTGHILITKEGELKWFCPDCRFEGRKYGVPFFSARAAAGVVAKTQERSMARDGVHASIKDAIGYRQNADQRRNDDRPQISEERKRKASRNLFALEDGDPGEYLVVPPNWEVGKEGERKVVDTWILIESKGFNFVKILGAGPGFGKHVGAFFSRTDLPPAIFAAIKKDQAKQQG